MIRTLHEPYLLPAVFANNTISVEPVTTSGARLRYYTDSGGDDWMYLSTAASLRLVDGRDRRGERRTSIQMPPFRDDAWIPSPNADGSIMLNPTSDELDDAGPQGPAAGLLGQSWFSRYPWEIDYSAESFLLHPELPAGDRGVAVPLGIAESGGERLNNFARIRATVSGEPLDLLLDTGAQTELTPDAVARIGGSGSIHATSFVISSIVARWRSEQPDWPVVEKGEAGSGATMIQVPSLQVGGLTTGPVWFTQRADRNFLDYMSQWTDRTVVGALGGNALCSFRLLLDIPFGRLFLRPI